MSGGSIRSGQEAGSGTGTASCSGGNGSYLETTTWQDGKTSTLSASFILAGGVATATGTVTDGEFSGTQVRDVEVVSATTPPPADLPAEFGAPRITVF
jgi:hypothetical protein